MRLLLHRWQSAGSAGSALAARRRLSPVVHARQLRHAYEPGAAGTPAAGRPAALATLRERTRDESAAARPAPEERARWIDHGAAGNVAGGWPAGTCPGRRLPGVERWRRTRPHDSGAVCAGRRRPLALRGARGADAVQPEPARSPAAAGRSGSGAGPDRVDPQAGPGRTGNTLVLRCRRTLPDRRADGPRGVLLRRPAPA